MEKIKYLKLMPLTAVMVLLAASCGSENEMPMPEAGRHATVTFSVKVDRTNASRSNSQWQNPGTGEVSGTGIENAINNLTMAIYKAADNSFVGTVSNLTLLKEADGVHTYVGNLPEENDKVLVNTSTGYRIMVFANTPEGSTVGDNPGGLTFTHADGTTPADIPMWGVKATTFTLDKDKAQDIGAIHLMRAMAKVEVSLSKRMVDDGYTLSGLTVGPANTSGHILPGNWATATATTDIGYDDSFNVFDGGTTVSSINMTQTESGKWIAYIPEYDNTSAGVTHATVSLTLNQPGAETPADFTLQFATYTDGAATTTYHNIVRNHLYSYVISGSLSDITPVYTLCEWNDGVADLPPFN